MIEAVKELIDKYQSITLEQLKSLWENEVEQNPGCVIDGGWVLSLITGFGSCACVLCKAANQRCLHCIHQYNPEWDSHGNPCMDGLYSNMEEAKTPEELYEYIPKRIEYLKSLIECSNNNK
jgi:hypothetical protein